MLRRFLGICGLAVAMMVSGAVMRGYTQETSDELRLRNGVVLKGRVVEVDKNTVTFRTETGVLEFKRSETVAVFFGGATEVVGEFPPGFTAKPPLKLKRVITFRRITTNKATEEGKFEPECVKISADGSKIVFWARKSGLYTINPDGTERNLVWAPDNTERTSVDPAKFEVSPDGKVIYWQGVHPIYRINSDGANEKILVRQGGEYEPLRLRQGGKRIFFSSRPGIYSIDTEGRGDYKEIITNGKLAKLWEISGEQCMLGRFDASEDGKRVAFVVGGFPKAKTMQLCAINADGTGLRRIVETDFDPIWLNFTPDGNQILFWKHSAGAYMVNWDGSNLHEVPVPNWDGNSGYFQAGNMFSPDGQWFKYEGGESGGETQICKPDGSDRFDVLHTGRWDYYDNALFHGLYPPGFTADLRKFVGVTQYWRQSKPRQLVFGEINPRRADGLPVLSDIEFPEVLSMNPQVPQHKGTLKVRIKKGASDVERVQFMLSPVSQQCGTDPIKWDANRGWNGLQGDHLLRDNGKGGDEVAGDGVYTTDNLMPAEKQWQWQFATLPGHYCIRIVAHDDQNAVIVDVDGVEIK